MAHVDYFLSTISPFTYLAGARPAEVAAAAGATITYKPLDIAGLFGRTGGQALKDRHPARQEYRLIEMRRQADTLAMPLNLHPAH